MPKSIEIKNIEEIHFWLHNDLEPMIIKRPGKTFNIAIQITVFDVSDETLEPKATES